ncbi:MAG TPA: hypothetical protein VK524_22750 [Polyangiaceae bacterium]|nr:hypothetical protein [Polyangiaceae bacterium]
MPESDSHSAGSPGPTDDTHAAPADPPEGAKNRTSDAEQSAADDLAAGLDLMLRAARKALKNIEPARIEELGKRAMRSVENLDRKAVSELGKKAAKNLDPRRIEEVAEEAGRELMSVIERVAERVEDMIGPKPPSQKPGAPPGADANPPGNTETKPRVRVEDGSG